MKKLINIIYFMLCIFLGFLVACVIFTQSVSNDQKWGDFATWLGAIAACLALLIAVIAAFMAKHSAEVQNDNSTFLSLNNIVENRSEKINQAYNNMTSCFEGYRQTLKMRTNGACEASHVITSYSNYQDDLLKNINIIKSIIVMTIRFIEKSDIRNDYKQEVIILFFSLIHPYFPMEIIKGHETTVFFSHAPSHSPVPGIYRMRQKEITDLMREYNLFPELFNSGSDEDILV